MWGLYTYSPNTAMRQRPGICDSQPGVYILPPNRAIFTPGDSGNALRYKPDVLGRSATTPPPEGSSEGDGDDFLRHNAGLGPVEG